MPIPGAREGVSFFPNSRELGGWGGHLSEKEVGWGDGVLPERGKGDRQQKRLKGPLPQKSFPFSSHCLSDAGNSNVRDYFVWLHRRPLEEVAAFN